MRHTHSSLPIISKILPKTSNDEFFWLEKETVMEDLKYKKESKNNYTFQVDDSINTSDILNGNDFLVPDMSYYGPENMFPTRRKLYSDSQVKLE